MSLSSLGTLVARIARRARPDEAPLAAEPPAPPPAEAPEIAPEIIPEPENVLGEVATYVCRDGTLSHLARDECIGRSLHYYGEWGFREIELLRTFVKPGDTVLDIGANVGTHTIALGRLVGEQGTVLGFEGQPHIHSILAHNIVQNGMSKWVHAFNMLVGSAQRLVPQALLPADEINNTGAKSFFHDVSRSRLGQGEPTIWLAMATIDQLDLPQCDLMKIDVEAMEVEVFRGGLATLRRHQPVVYFEHAMVGPEHLIAIAELLSPLGYKFAWHIANPFNSDNFRGVAQNIFGGNVEVNVLALPAERAFPDGVVPIEDLRAPPPRPSPEEALHG